MKVVNIKENNPNVDYAIYLLETAISDCKKCGEKGFIVLHGYGSNGIGGDIKRAAMQFLNNAQKKGIIKSFIKGEEWSNANPLVKQAIKSFPELILQENLYTLNSGVSVVLLS